MATSYRDRVGQAFETLAEGLEPFISAMLAGTVPDADWAAALAARDARRGMVYEKTDPKVQLQAIDQFWPAFRDQLPRSARSWANELRSTRDAWAHNQPFSADDAYRALDTAERLLVATAAGEKATAVRHSKEELQRYRYEETARKAARATPSVNAAASGLTPWREVVLPHPDVRGGKFVEAEFAADLEQVHRGDPNTAPEYADPVEFFRRTYLTDGLSELLRQAVRRVTGRPGGVPVVDLQTNFGGGKTHTLLALYHLFGGTPLAEYPQELQNLIASADVRELPAVTRAVLVGLWLKPGQADEKPDGTLVHTMWGELAWQLGGKPAYDMLADSDAVGTNPGNVLVDVLRAHAPCVILVDEWVAYARGLFGKENLPGGTFETQFTFAHALTEAAAAIPGVLLVASLPASDGGGSGPSDIETGGPAGAAALSRLRNVVHRVDSSWRPASVEESFEIVRRRLFEPIPHDRLPARDATARRFREFYRSRSGEFPSECGTADYEKRIKAAYPIHPELFDRLYDDWSTLDRFQRTRGVLRLVAKVVHALWEGGDQGPLVMPGSVPLDIPDVAEELARYLEENWRPILDVDVDGPSSLPAELDTRIGAFGQRMAARRVARSVFLGSAPTAESANRGIEDLRIRLGTVLPGESPATFGDALRTLSERATYLYAEGSRYWYSVRPTVVRKAADLAELYRRRVDDLDDQIVERLHLLEMRNARGDFARVHACPPDSSAVADDPEARLVVLQPAVTHTPRDEKSQGVIFARSVLDRHGNSPRLFQNALVFLAPDARRIDELRAAVAEYLAWKELDGNRTQLNLDQQQISQVAAQLDRADKAVGRRLTETYQLALVPTQTEVDDPVVRLDELRCDGAEGLAERVSRKLVTNDQLRVVTNPASIRSALDGPLAALWDDGHVSVGKLWETYARYCYLRRLRDQDVLIDAVARGPETTSWEVDGFAVADSYDANAGRYVGLIAGAQVQAVTASSLLVRPDVAQTQLEAERRQEPSGVKGSVSAAAAASKPATPQSPHLSRRFHGAVELDTSGLLSKQFGKIAEEVLNLLRTHPSANMAVTLEVHATADDGFPDATVRAVKENARTLGFTDADFEDR
jgi:predicted AAA+ superfamily ATPase